MEKMTAEKAKEIMGKGFHCSQVVFAYGAEKLGMDVNEALKLSGGLGGGCYNGDSCGAVTGAAMALGLKYGFSNLTPDIKAQNAILVGMVKKFNAIFKERYGATLCRDILGYDMGTPEGLKMIAETKATKNCPAMCAGACDILDELFAED